MKGTEELEPQQYQRQYWEEDVPLRDVRKNVLRRFVYVGAFLFLLFILAGSFIKFPDEVQLPFVIKADRSEDIYRFPYPVYLVEKYVAPGTGIKKGEPLAKITSPEIVALISSFQEARQNFGNYSGQQTLSVGKQKEMIVTKVEQNRRKISEVQKELQTLDSVWASNRARLDFERKDAEEKYEKNKKLYTGKFISGQELKEYEMRSIYANDALVTAGKQYEKDRNVLNALHDQYSLEIVSLGQELGKTTIDSRYDSVKYNDQLTLAGNRIKNTFGDFELADGAIIIKASADGIVSFVFEGDKEIPGGSVLLKMQYDKTPLYSLIVSPPSLVGKLAVKQPVFLKVATFPSYEWGVIAGHIDNISLTPDEKGTFNVKVAFDDMRKMKGYLQSGMDGNATVVLSERTFFEYFFRDLKKGWHSATMND